MEYTLRTIGPIMEEEAQMNVRKKTRTDVRVNLLESYLTASNISLWNVSSTSPASVTTTITINCVLGDPTGLIYEYCFAILFCVTKSKKWNTPPTQIKRVPITLLSSRATELTSTLECDPPLLVLTCSRSLGDSELDRPTNDHRGWGSGREILVGVEGILECYHTLCPC